MPAVVATVLWPIMQMADIIPGSGCRVLVSHRLIRARLYGHAVPVAQFPLLFRGTVPKHSAITEAWTLQSRRGVYRSEEICALRCRYLQR